MAKEIKEFELHGDGLADDTIAIEAFLQGKRVVWATSGVATPDTIMSRRFAINRTLDLQTKAARNRRLAGCQFVALPDFPKGATMGTVNGKAVPNPQHFFPRFSGCEFIAEKRESLQVRRMRGQ